MNGPIWRFPTNLKCKLTGEGKLPSRSTPGSAGYDVYASEVDLSRLRTHGQIIYKTGLSFELNEGCVGLLFPRSSIRNTRLRLANGVGVIDSDYRGEISFTFDFDGPMAVQGMDARPLYENQAYKTGDRIGQLVVTVFSDLKVFESNISETERGTGGYGSTGK